MIRVCFDKFGDPRAVLRLDECETPEPGAHDVLIRMRARPVNPSDMATIRGLYGSLPLLPATPGLEGMGIVERTGSAVTGISAGQRVIPLGVRGTWAEYVVANVAAVLPVADQVPDNAAAQFVVNPLTAWVMLTDELKLGPGDWLIQTAAGSALGRMVLQIARLRGFKTINIVRRREQAEELKALGADEVIWSEGEDIAARVREITENHPPRCAIDAIGGAVAARVLSAMSDGGVMLVYGMLSAQATPLDNRLVIFRDLTIRGFWLSRWFAAASPEEKQRVAGGMMQMMATGKIVPAVEAEYDLRDFQMAVEHSERPGRKGKVLLTG